MKNIADLKIATVLNVHGGTEIVKDTLDSIKTWVGNKTLVVVDGAHWDWGQSTELPAVKVQGFYHNCPKSPYRNMTFGLMQAARTWPKMDWYLYCEYDVLFTSSDFKEDLVQAQEENVWCMGSDYRIQSLKFPLLEAMLKTEFQDSRYLLGACVFHSGDFIRKLVEMDFFERFLNYTNPFPHGFFPGFDEQGGYDFGEHLYPTLANHYGGGIKQTAVWKQGPLGNFWGGNFRRYTVRFRPEIDAVAEHYPEVSVIHPIKDYQHPIREFHRIKRQRINRIKNERQSKFRAHNFGLRGGLKLGSTNKRAVAQSGDQDAGG